MSLYKIKQSYIKFSFTQNVILDISILLTINHFIRISKSSISHNIPKILQIVLLCLDLPINNIPILIFGLPFYIYNMIIKLLPYLLPFSVYLLLCKINTTDVHAIAILSLCDQRVVEILTCVAVVVDEEFIDSDMDVVT